MKMKLKMKPNLSGLDWKMMEKIGKLYIIMLIIILLITKKIVYIIISI
jgi:hypothetical protein